MVQRASTPPLSPDEPKVLVVTHPYPPHPNLERPQDLICVVFWLACCIGEDHLRNLSSICHKPTADDMLLIEMSHDFPDYRRLLGAHKWSEFVREPGTLMDDVSCIYFSSLSDCRAVEKAGWKRIFVQDEWFKQFSVRNRYIAYPYPPTTYCSPPPENKTAERLCRPLPSAMFGIKKKVPVTVGTAKWVKQKEADVARRPNSKAISTGGASSSSSFCFAEDSSSFYGHDATNASDLPDFSSLRIDGPPSDATITDSMSSSSGNFSSNSSDMGDIGNCNIRDIHFVRPCVDDWGIGDIVPPPDMEPDKPICPTHHMVCKKAICQDYNRLLKRLEREKSQAERAAKMARVRESRERGRGRGRGRRYGGHSPNAEHSPQGRW